MKKQSPVNEEESPLSVLISPDFIADELIDRAKGYGGSLRGLLVTAAKLIRGYQEDRPFRECVATWQHAFVMAGVHTAANVADAMGQSEVAAAIKAKEVPLQEADAFANRIGLLHTNLMSARKILIELKAEGLLDPKYDKALKAIFFDHKDPLADPPEAS